MEFAAAMVEGVDVAAANATAAAAYDVRVHDDMETAGVRATTTATAFFHQVSDELVGMPLAIAHELVDCESGQAAFETPPNTESRKRIRAESVSERASLDEFRSLGAAMWQFVS